MLDLALRLLATWAAAGQAAAAGGTWLATLLHYAASLLPPAAIATSAGALLLIQTYHTQPLSRHRLSDTVTTSPGSHVVDSRGDGGWQSVSLPVAAGAAASAAVPEGQLGSAAARALLLGLHGQREAAAVLWLATAQLSATGQLPRGMLHRWGTSPRYSSLLAME